MGGRRLRKQKLNRPVTRPGVTFWSLDQGALTRARKPNGTLWQAEKRPPDVETDLELGYPFEETGANRGAERSSCDDGSKLSARWRSFLQSLHNSPNKMLFVSHQITKFFSS
jgi:hypothetical protein